NELLLENRLITEKEMTRALEQQHSKGGQLLNVLIEGGFNRTSGVEHVAYNRSRGRGYADGEHGY
ncbi:MAG: hypothetical protein KKF93_05395, partial [Candidatus Omnitrophica bacterium]|nr:hypothetical protein [Candidatus Omnitrophota bacterium]